MKHLERFFSFLSTLLLTWIPLSPLFPAQSPPTPPPLSLLKNHQLELMEFVLNYPQPRNIEIYSATLEKIYQVYLQLDNKKETLDFYSTLLDSERYRKLYPYVFYQLSRFFSRPLKDRYLVQALDYASGDPERRFILEKLYQYYKQENLHYLELSYLLKLITAQERTKDIAGLHGSYHELGKIHQRQKDYLSALNSYFTALAYANKLAANQAGYIYLSIADVFQVLNRRELARKYVQEALDFAIKNKTQKLKVLVLNIYSQLSYEEGNYPEALRYIDRCLTAEKDLKSYICSVPVLYRKSLILRKQAEILPSTSPTAKKLREESEKLLETAIQQAIEHHQYENLLPILGDYIDDRIRNARYTEARQYIQDIDEFYAPFHPYYFFYYYLQARLHHAQGQLNEAMNDYVLTAAKLEEYFDALPGRQDRLDLEITNDIYDHMMEFYLDMFKLTHNQQYIDQALYFSEIKNAYTYELEIMKNKSYEQLSQEKHKLENEFLQFNQEFTQVLREHAPQPTLQLYETKLEALKKQNRELQDFLMEIPVTYKKYHAQDLDMNVIRKKLAPGQLIIKYTLLKNNAYAFRIDRQTVRFIKLSTPSADIMAMVQSLTQPLDDFTQGKVDYLRVNYDLTMAQQLYNILLRDVLPQGTYPPITELFIIPDKELFKLPFEALVTGYNNRHFSPRVIFSEYASANYLIEKYPVAYLISLFHFQQHQAPAKNKSYIMAAFGSPVLPERLEIRDPLSEDQQNIKLFRSLPSSKKEINTIGDIFGYVRIRLFTDQVFTRENFEMIAPRASIVHIATHFINNKDYPQYSALLFSPGKESGPFYYAHEIFNLKLNADLVVLSACESSEKHLSGWQGLRGMTAGFRHAGTRAMIVSMWPVDEHSWQLTPLFYFHYHQHPAAKLHQRISPSLRQAKLQLMKKTARLSAQTEISFSHPFLWANYIVYHFSY